MSPSIGPVSDMIAGDLPSIVEARLSASAGTGNCHRRPSTFERIRRLNRHRIDQARLIGARARLDDLQGRRPAVDPVLIDDTPATMRP